MTLMKLAQQRHRAPDHRHERRGQRHDRAFWEWAPAPRTAHTERVQVPLESNFLISNGRFFVLLLVSLAVVGLLVIWPLVETVARQQWGYTLGVVLLGPIGGLLCFVVGRRETTRRNQRDDESRMRVTHSV
jgi:hypothetical protein